MPQLKVRIGCVVLAVIMSAVTYYLVEPRLRWGRFGGYKAAGLLSVMIVVGVAGYSIERHEGYTVRMNDPEQQVIDSINKEMWYDFQLFHSVFPDWAPTWDLTAGKFQRELGKNTIAIIGDSHAGHLYPGLITQTRENEGIALFPAGCAVPLIGLHSGREPMTEHYLSEGFSYILSHANIKKVVLSNRPGCSWTSLTDTRNPDNHDLLSMLRDGFVRTYDALTKAGKEIYVVIDNPAFPGKIWDKCNASIVSRPSSIPDFLLSKSINSCNIKFSEREEIVPRDSWTRLSHETAAGYSNIHFIDMAEPFCNNGSCSMIDRNGKMLYRDWEHLNMKGSFFVAPFIMEALRK